MTYRRHLLDQLLKQHVEIMQGVVVDLGGGKARRRGRFKGGERDTGRWVYLNIDRSVEPDVIADIEEVPLRSASADCVICCEVLEHVRNPQRCCDEALRILRPGGALILSVPFLFPIHEDPGDYRRFTSEGVLDLCGAFQSARVAPMGGWVGTVGMLLDLGARDMSAGFGRRMLRRAVRVLGRALSSMEASGLLGSTGAAASISTGYFCVARK